jgi:hypothetical protein
VNSSSLRRAWIRALTDLLCATPELSFSSRTLVLSLASRRRCPLTRTSVSIRFALPPTSVSPLRSRSSEPYGIRQQSWDGWLTLEPLFRATSFRSQSPSPRSAMFAFNDSPRVVGTRSRRSRRQHLDLARGRGAGSQPPALQPFEYVPLPCPLTPQLRVDLPFAVDAKIEAEFKLPSTWILTAQLVFGKKEGEAHPKEFQAIEERVKVFGAKQ